MHTISTCQRQLLVTDIFSTSSVVIEILRACVRRVEVDFSVKQPQRLWSHDTRRFW
jgi:hypothetical protein